MKNTTETYIARIQNFFDNFEKSKIMEKTYEKMQVILNEIVQLPEPMRNAICYQPSLRFKFNDDPISLMDLLSNSYVKTIYVRNMAISSHSIYYVHPIWEHRSLIQLLNAGIDVPDDLAIKLVRNCCERFPSSREDLEELLQALKNSGKNILNGNSFMGIKDVLEHYSSELRGTWVEELTSLPDEDVKAVNEQLVNDHEVFKKSMLLLCCAREFDAQCFVAKDEFPRDMFNVTFKR